MSKIIFDKIIFNQKTVEARVAIPKYTTMSVGDTINFICMSNEKVSRKISGKALYRSFKEMLEAECIESCLPGVTDIHEAEEFYKNLYKDSQRQDGVVVLFRFAIGKLQNEKVRVPDKKKVEESVSEF